MSAARYRLLLFAAAFLFSTGGAAIKGCHFTSWQIASFRSGVAALTVAVLLPESRGIFRPRICLLGFAYAATVALFVLATKLTTSAQAIFLQSTAPLYMLFLAPLVLHERLRRSQLMMVALVAVGAGLLLFAEQRASRTAPDPVAGNWLGALCGLSWAVTMTGFRWLTKRSSKNVGATESPAAVVVAGNIIACFACLPMALPVSHAAPADAAVILYLGIFQIGLAYIAVTRSVRRVPAIEATTLLLLEPVFNPLWTWLLYAETPTPATLAGGALIFCAACASTVYQARQPHPLT